MQAPLSGTYLQRQILRLYGELLVRREGWAGKLVFACGAGVSATGLSVAVSIAGGTSLMLDPDATAVKAVLRQGGLDFVVNTLDEALRVLKNEIRKQRPLSVGLIAEMQPALAEMVERGVLPDLLVSGDPLQKEPVEIGVLEQVGMERLLLSERSDLLRGWLAERGWSETMLEAATASELRELDARLIKLLPAADRLRRTWLQRIGHYQRVSGGGVRMVWLTEAERAALGIGEIEQK